ncbi:MAG: insulinase family protein, partial [Acidobacteria bacterium]|nr:insulinase family protein [Acidobacteriota bacterium]
MSRKYNLLFVALVLVSFFTWDMPAANRHKESTFRLPAYEKFILENGLTVFLMEQHEVPLIFVSAEVPAGAAKDNGQYGLAYLTSEALLFGTKSYSKNQIEEKLDFLGALYFTDIDAEMTKVSASFAAKDLDIVLPVIKELIADPIFDESEFGKRKERLVLELEQQKESPGDVIRFYFNKF